MSTGDISSLTLKMASERAIRIRTLTPKALEQYEERLGLYVKRLKSIDSEIFKIIEANPSLHDLSLTDLIGLRELILQLHERYLKLYAEVNSFLVTTNTEESRKESAIMSLKDNNLRDCIFTFLKAIEEAQRGYHEERSEHSKTKSHSSKATSHSSRSKRSDKSSVSMTLKQAKVKAAKVKMEYAKKEADLQMMKATLLEKDEIATAAANRQKSELDTKIKLLKNEKAVAAAEAEVEALESSFMDFRSRASNDKLVYIPSWNPQQRTAEYVHKHPFYTEQSQTVNPQTLAPGPQSNLNPTAPIFQPNTETATPGPQQQIVSDVTKFLLRKDLLLSRLSLFNDKPDGYRVWKASFKNVIQELNVSDFEEFDLLIKWLGPESKNHAINIRNAHMTDLKLGLQRIWERLDDRYGSPEMLDEVLKKKLRDFPNLTNKDNRKLLELSDLVSEIESLKLEPKLAALLAYYDSSSGVTPIVNKLPYNLREKWVSQAANYKKCHNVPFPPFCHFAQWLRDISKIRNDPSLSYTQESSSHIGTNGIPPNGRAGRRQTGPSRPTVTAYKTDAVSTGQGSQQRCPIHKTNHSLNECRAFQLKSLDERKKWLKDHNFCFKCCNSTEHKSKECVSAIKCTYCGSTRHSSALHIDMTKSSLPISLSQNQGLDSGSQTPGSRLQHGGERSSVSLPSLPLQDGERTKGQIQSVNSKCTQICGGSFSGKSCAKTVLVKVYPKGQHEKAVRMYAILDDQSNRTLARSNFFQLLNVNAKEIEYTLSSCAGIVVTSGRTAHDLVVESLDGSSRLELPNVLECNEIPNSRDEIPTPEVAFYHSHLNDISEYIPPLDTSAAIMLLIGRDLPEAHHVYDQRTGPKGSPYAQNLKLGWVIVGETCLGGIHKTDFVNVKKTSLLSNGRPTVLKPCMDEFSVSIKSDPVMHDCTEQYDSVFQRRSDDNKQSLSVEDRQFLEIMDNHFQKDCKGHLSAPLPFKPDRPTLPNNREDALRRAKSLHASLNKNPVKKQHFKDFMNKMLENGHAEEAPSVAEEEECWYLPIFGVYHPQKPDQIRCVFDSSAQHNGISLNKVLLQGPDLINSLLGVLLRFRRETIAIAADIQQMFYSFYVNHEHRNYLRFFWYKDNDFDKPLVEFRMCVHVFGNSPSPAIATYGLRQSVKNSDDDVKSFVNDDFYVDDALTSLPSAQQAISLMKRTQADLQCDGLTLHKVISNDEEVVSAFPPEDRAKGLKDLVLGIDSLPIQRSLGMRWDLNTDTFSFDASEDSKPFTRRGVLSSVNSLFDPIGFLSPVTIQGKIILRSLMQGSVDWDEPLPQEKQDMWTTWRKSLTGLNQIHIPRCYSHESLSQASGIELHVFSDASELAIAAVTYLLICFPDGSRSLSFVFGKAKVAPIAGHTIPRLELCAAVLAAELSETVKDAIKLSIQRVKFYTDSRIVLGYIYNKTRRFYTYISNRVAKIHGVSAPEQWNFVSTHLNPADDGTRGVPVSDLQHGKWLCGPSFLLKSQGPESPDGHYFPLIDPDGDAEVRNETQVVTCVTKVSVSSLGTEWMERFSSWKKLVKAIANLQHIAQTFKRERNTTCGCKGWHICAESHSVNAFKSASKIVLRAVQLDAFSKELACLTKEGCVPKDSSIISLGPFLDSDGVMRVGGRLRKAAHLVSNEKNPIILPSKNHVSKLIAIHCHETVKHQGRHFTEGQIRSEGYCGKRLVSSIVFNCVPCRKLRGRFEYQRMADLPADRLEESPPFTYVGVDVFGPWSVVTRRTRGGQANSKRWAVLFTCLCIRAIHIEVIEDMSSSAFINALRRFVAIRGKVKQFRSDRGTNFVGATSDLGIDTVNVEDQEVKKVLFNSGSVWIFNPPHSSHMGGAWERMIGMTRRLLESVLKDVGILTHEVLVTLMAEVSAIVNSRPLIPVSYDSEVPEILRPSTILTHKTDIDEKPACQLDMKDLYKAQWKRVQHLSDLFWSRWKRDYLQTLQTRKKWNSDKECIGTGDVVLLRDDEVGRAQWPIARVVNVFPSDDNRVRKVEVKVFRNGEIAKYVRPIVKLVLLVKNNQT